MYKEGEALQTFDYLEKIFHCLKKSFVEYKLELSELLKKGRDQYNTSEPLNPCAGIIYYYKQILNKIQNLLWYTCACYFGDAHKYKIGECIERKDLPNNEVELKDRVFTIEIKGKTVIKNNEFCVLSYECLRIWGKSKVKKNIKEQNLNDMLIDQLSTKYDNLMKDILNSLPNTVNNRTINKQQVQALMYSLETYKIGGTNPDFVIYLNLTCSGTNKIYHLIPSQSIDKIFNSLLSNFIGVNNKVKTKRSIMVDDDENNEPQPEKENMQNYQPFTSPSQKKRLSSDIRSPLSTLKVSLENSVESNVDVNPSISIINTISEEMKTRKITAQEKEHKDFQSEQSPAKRAKKREPAEERVRVCFEDKVHSPNTEDNVEAAGKTLVSMGDDPSVKMAFGDNNLAILSNDYETLPQV
jgi:hypothetical protein